MTHQRYLLLIVALLVLLPFVLSSCSKKISAQVLNDYTFEDLSGSSLKLPASGQYMVVNFWATWCIPCTEELPELSSLNSDLHNSNIRFVGISIDDKEKTAKFFNANARTSFSILTSNSDAMQLSEQLGNDKEVVPYTVVIDPDGVVIKRIFGRVDIQALKTLLNTLPAL